MPEEIKPSNGKTPEQIKADKFAANPDSFVDMEELVIAVNKNEKGYGFIVNPKATRIDLHYARSELFHRVGVMLMNMDMQLHFKQQEEKKIIPAKKHDVMDFARRK